MRTCTAAPLLRPLVVTTAFKGPSVRPDRLVTVNDVAVEAVTVPVPVGEKTTVFCPGVVLKFVPAIVIEVTFDSRLAVARVTVGGVT